MDINSKDVIEIHKKIDSTLDIMRYVFILQAKQSGVSQENVRKILKINNNQLSAIWRLLQIN